MRRDRQSQHDNRYDDYHIDKDRFVNIFVFREWGGEAKIAVHSKKTISRHEQQRGGRAGRRRRAFRSNRLFTRAPANAAKENNR